MPTSRPANRKRRTTGGPARLDARLRYALDDRQGIHRHRAGRGFYYIAVNGRRIRNPGALDRIRRLAIPPAWKEVWIAPEARAHLQATGRDARGRKQYRYHPGWRAQRETAKFESLVDFAQCLPRLRRRVARDLRRRGLPRAKVLAAVVRLLEVSLIRVGNDEYSRHNGSYGLTTMEDRHAAVSGSQIRFRFRGKSGILRTSELDSPQLARIVRRCQALPGQQLFQFMDEEGIVHDIGSHDVNQYLQEAAGRPTTAKEFRTWVGTVLAVQAFRKCPDFDSLAAGKRQVRQTIETVAARLGNTVTVCRNCYVHPAVVEAYLDQSLESLNRPRRAKQPKAPLRGLTTDETATLRLLQHTTRARAGSRRLKRASERASSGQPSRGRPS